MAEYGGDHHRSAPPKADAPHPTESGAVPPSDAVIEGIDEDSPLHATTVEEDRIAAAGAAVRDAAPHLGGSRTPPTQWDDVRLRVDPSPVYQRASRPPRKSWPFVVLTMLAAAAVIGVLRLVA